ncbi:MAG TPA: polyprenol monophosphomannose synthase [Dermatophilaceae bacterium]|nr:polyprenol monophosphomannose synthase [Dermatophilaceae bacterium]
MSDRAPRPVADRDRGPVERILVCVPTFNERENLPRIVARLRAAVPEAEVLVLDDSSPDGTGEVADRLAAADAAVHVLHRSRKEGLGAAYLAGFAWGLERGYDALVEMDADGSHQPESLRSLLAELAGADVVLGSRWVPGGSVLNWPLHRKALSVGGNLYTRVLLGIPVGDATGGYRVYRSTALKELDLHDVASQGYCFQVDLAWRAIRRGLTVTEVPITFVEREIGDSKMSGAIVRESLLRITDWGLRHRLGQLRRLGRQLRPAARSDSARTPGAHRRGTWHRL